MVQAFRFTVGMMLGGGYASSWWAAVMFGSSIPLLWALPGVLTLMLVVAGILMVILSS